MAYVKGTRLDGQSRIAQLSQGEGQVNGPLPLISSGDAPATIHFDWTNPSAAARDLLARVAIQAQAQIQGLNAGTLPAPAVAPPIGAQATALPATRRPTLPLDDLSVADGSEFWMLADAVNPGQQSTALPVPRARSLGLDSLTIDDASEFWMLVDQTNAGAQQTELPPRSALRARDYSIAASFPLVLIGQDAMVVGQQLSGNAPPGPRRASTLSETGVNQTVVVSSAVPVIPCGQSTSLSELSPRAAARARDYSLTLGLLPDLVGQDQVNPGQQLSGPGPIGALRARDYSIAAAFPLTLIGQDAVVVGKQRLELAPLAAARARDYSLTVSFPLELIGADAVNPGQQLSGNAPAGARRASTLTDPGVNLTLIISQAPPVIPPGLSTLTTELPPRGAARARDYSLAASFPLELNGKDQLFGAPGQVPAYDWSYLPPKPRYQQGTGEAFQDLLSTLLVVVAQAIPPGAQSVDLAPKPAPRARDYTFTFPLDLSLRGQDAMTTGVQISGPAPRGYPRANDYSILASFPLELIGADAMAPGDQSTALPPRGPQRAADYTWLHALPLHLIGQDATNPGDQLTDLPPRGPARLRDYSLAEGFNAGTFPQENIPTGDQWTALAPAGAARLREYTFTASTQLQLITPVRDLFYIVGPPEAKWRVGTILLPKFGAGPPTQ